MTLFATEFSNFFENAVRTCSIQHLEFLLMTSSLVTVMDNQAYLKANSAFEFYCSGFKWRMG